MSPFTPDLIRRDADPALEPHPCRHAPRPQVAEIDRLDVACQAELPAIGAVASIGEDFYLCRARLKPAHGLALAAIDKRREQSDGGKDEERRLPKRGGIRRCGAE